ncbi:MAG TPA: L-histidine N(alpha)-methyltransferase [Acidobacteriota bacterium]|nr:L-histidine N(alpha)-methyltransferase [Acidobacteriota bacterium]
MLNHAAVSEPISAFAEDVRSGLTAPGQKELPSKYLYDDVGSALFEAICVLPEYGLSRADERLLRRHATEIADRLPKPIVVAELGCGSGKKTRWILEAISRHQFTQYRPIEISPAALTMCRRELGGIDSVNIVGLEREYLDGLREVVERRKPGQKILLLFLGSTIGNFESPADARFLSEIRRLLRAGDSLLLGTDLEKPIPVLTQAYDDPLGVTAAFNLNLLARINRELEGDFNLREFAHCAKFNHATRSIEMHLRSKREQTVNIERAEFSAAFEEGETIWTESSHKYSMSEILRIAEISGFRCAEHWIDREWPFAENLLIAE